MFEGDYGSMDRGCDIWVIFKDELVFIRVLRVFKVEEII